MKCFCRDSRARGFPSVWMFCLADLIPGPSIDRGQFPVRGGDLWVSCFFFFFAFIKFLLDKNQASTFMRGTVSFSFQCSAKIKKQWYPISFNKLKEKYKCSIKNNLQMPDITRKRRFKQSYLQILIPSVSQQSRTTPASWKLRATW